MSVALASTSSQYDFWPYWSGPCSRTVAMGCCPMPLPSGGKRGDRRRQVGTKQHRGGKS